jgi:hypothetical protein
MPIFSVRKIKLIKIFKILIRKIFIIFILTFNFYKKIAVIKDKILVSGGGGGKKFGLLNRIVILLFIF